MRQCIVIATMASLVLSVFGCGASGNQIPEQARTSLEQAAEIELLSLDPEHLTDPPPDAFHGWKVLGKTVVKDAKTRQQLIDAFEQGVRNSTGAAAACFDPRHGIRVTHNDTTVSFVICFECLQVQIYFGDQKQPGVRITDSPEPVFDRVLKQAGVPLAEKSE